MAIDVSVIMPVYNSKEYLPTAIDSILNQDYENFELLLVDDGSSDGSEKICDMYAKQHENVIAFHKKNGGICNARNFGLNKAKGTYIMFCDNDDIFLPGAIKDNIEYAKQYDADIVRYSRRRVHVGDGESTEEKFIYGYDFSVLEGKDVVKNYSIMRNISSGIWCSLYRRSIIEEHGICFREDFKSGFEDMYFNIEYSRYIEKAVLNPHVYYHWIQRDHHSTSKKYSDNMLYALDECLKREYEYVKEIDIIEAYPGTWEDLLTNYYVLGTYITLLIPSAPYTMKQKISIMKKIRNQECFNQISKKSLKALKNIDLKRYLILKAFLWNQHRLNFHIVDFYSRKISNIA